jgi:hypothetical protein
MQFQTFQVTKEEILQNTKKGIYTALYTPRNTCSLESRPEWTKRPDDWPICHRPAIHFGQMPWGQVGDKGHVAHKPLLEELRQFGRVGAPLSHIAAD